MTQRFWFHVCFDFCFDGFMLALVVVLALVVAGLAPTPHFLLHHALDSILPAVISVRSVETTLRHKSLKNHRYYQTIRLVRNERIFKIHNV